MMKMRGKQNAVRSVALFWATTTFCFSPIFGQVDANALGAKYGAPVEQVFHLRSDMTLTVTYGANRQVCSLEIRPTRNSSTIPASLVDEIVNEVVPPDTRGAQKQQVASCAGAICWKMTDYEKLRIGQIAGDLTGTPDSQPQNSLAVIHLKSCPGQQAR
jgi:hypothetical protein